MTEKRFGIAFHMKRAIIFNKLYLVFKYILRWCPFLIFAWYIVPNYFVIFSAIATIALISWLGSVKMKSLRNINFYAAKQFKLDHATEMSQMFR